MRAQRRRRPAVLVSLLLTAVLTVALGLVIYVAVTSLPYLAVSPSTDPTFGALNACALEHLPERTGFALSRDLKRLVAWSSEGLVDCPSAAVQQRSGITSGAFDGHGGLWLSLQSSDVEGPGLVHLSPDGAKQEIRTLSAQALAGTGDGVILLEPSGQLVSLSDSGAVRGSYQLPTNDVRGSSLSSSGDGQRVAVILGGGLFAFSAALRLLGAQAPCEVRGAWWLSGSHALILECAGQLALRLDVDSGRSETVPRRERVPSTLAGPEPVWVQSCDVLPCTAVPPEPLDSGR